MMTLYIKSAKQIYLKIKLSTLIMADGYLITVRVTYNIFKENAIKALFLVLTCLMHLGLDP